MERVENLHRQEPPPENSIFWRRFWTVEILDGGNPNPRGIIRTNFKTTALVCQNFYIFHQTSLPATSKVAASAADAVQLGLGALLKGVDVDRMKWCVPGEPGFDINSKEAYHHYMMQGWDKREKQRQKTAAAAQPPPPPAAQKKPAGAAGAAGAPGKKGAAGAAGKNKVKKKRKTGRKIKKADGTEEDEEEDYYADGEDGERDYTAKELLDVDKQSFVEKVPVYAVTK